MRLATSVTFPAVFLTVAVGFADSNGTLIWILPGNRSRRGHTPRDSSMKRFFMNVRDLGVAGFLALLPVYVLVLVVEKVWKSLHSLGAGVAGIFGMPPLFGVHPNTILTAVLVVAVWIVFGLLVRFTFVGVLSQAAEGTMSKYVPDYAKYKSMAEERLQHKVKILDYSSALIRWQEYWRPAYLVEQDKDGNCVVFVPEVPETTKGQVVLAKRDQLKIVPSVTANQLDTLLKNMGRGLSSELGITGRDSSRVA